MDILNDDVLVIIISFLDEDCYINIGDYYEDKEHNKLYIQKIEVYLLNFVSKHFNNLIKTLGFDSTGMFDYYEYGCVVEEYFKQITKMNKPNLFREFQNDAIPLNSFMGIMDYACTHDYVGIVKYFHENKVKSASKNIIVYFYFTSNIVEELMLVSKNYKSHNVLKYLNSIQCRTYTSADKMYEMLLDCSNYENSLNESIIIPNNSNTINSWFRSIGFKLSYI